MTEQSQQSAEKDPATDYRLSRAVFAVLDDDDLVQEVAAALVFGTNEESETRRALLRLGHTIRQVESQRRLIRPGVSGAE